VSLPCPGEPQCGYPSDEETSKEEDEAEEGFINDKFNTALKSFIKVQRLNNLCTSYPDTQVPIIVRTSTLMCNT